MLVLPTPTFFEPKEGGMRAAWLGHSNAGSCGMDSSREMGALKQMWLNEGVVATIIPLKQLDKLWQVTYNSRCHGGAFVVHTDY